MLDNLKSLQGQREQENLDPQEEMVNDILQTLHRYESTHDDFYDRITDDWSFLAPGGMWTQEQVDILEERGQAPIEIPIIRPQVDQYKSQILGNAPTYRVLSRTDTDVKKGKLFSELLRYVWYKSKGDAQTDQIVDHQLISGKGYYYVEWDDMADDGYGLAKISSISPLYVIVDPNSTARDEEDARFKFIRKWVTREDAKRLFPDIEDAIDDLMSGEPEKTFISTLAEEQKVPVLDSVAKPAEDKISLTWRFRKITEKFYVVKYNNGQDVIEKELTEEELQSLEKIMRAGESQSGSEEIQSIKENIKDVEPNYRTRIEHVLMVGHTIVEFKILPTENYPLIPVPFHHFGNPFPASLARELNGLQKELNHRRSLAIHHASTSSHSKVIMPLTAVEDQDAFNRDWHRPDAVLYTDLNEGRPIVVRPTPLPNAFLQFDSVTKMDAQFIAGSFSISHGDASNAPRTSSATAMLDQWAGRRIGVSAKYLYFALDVLGRIVIDYIQAYMKKSRIIRIVNPYTNYEHEIVTLGIGDIYSDQDIDVIKDPSVGQYDVFVIAGSMAPSNRYVEFDLYMRAYQAGIIDREEVLKKTDIFDREGVIKRTGSQQQAKQALEQQQQQLEKLTKAYQDMQKDNEKLKEDLQEMEAETSLEKVKLDLTRKYDMKLIELERKIQDYELAIQTAKKKSDT